MFPPSHSPSKPSQVKPAKFKVIEYKSCGELCPLVQRTTCMYLGRHIVLTSNKNGVFEKKLHLKKITLLVLTKVAGSNPATAKIPLFTIIQSFEIVAY